jgi:Spy/CpxP family protein refolding chaperone
MNQLKNNLWFWGFVILLVLNLSLLLSIFFHGQQLKKDPRFRAFHSEMRMKKGDCAQMGDCNRPRWINDIANDESQAQFLLKEHQQHVEKVQEIKEKLHQKQFELFTAISQENIDSAVVSRNKMEIGQLQDEITNQTMKYYQTLKTKLNPDQMKQINDQVSQRIFKCEMPNHHPRRNF